MKVIFFGTPLSVAPILKELEENFDVVAVVTAPDKKVGREQKLTPSPIKNAYESYIWNSEKHKKNILTPGNLDDNFIKDLKDSELDLFVVAAYGKILPQEILDIPKMGAINIHPSLLPKYRGSSPVQSTILNGDRETGVTFILMDEKMDHGPIIYQERVDLNGTETFESLVNKLFEIASKSIIQAINMLANKKLNPKIQDDSEATFCKTLTKEDGYIDIDNPPTNIGNLIRAFYPWPGVWFKLNGKIIKLYPNGVIQMEGKNPVSYKDFINGYPQGAQILQKLNLDS